MLEPLIEKYEFLNLGSPNDNVNDSENGIFTMFINYFEFPIFEH